MSYFQYILKNLQKPALILLPALAFNIYWLATGATDAPYKWLWGGVAVFFLVIIVGLYFPWKKAYRK